MIIGEINTRSTPTVQIPLWDPLSGNGHPPLPSSPIHSPFSSSVNFNSANADYFNDFAATLHRYLPSNENTVIADFDSLSDSDSDLPPIDAFSCDYFRMYEFKVRRCARGRSHDWTECPYAHPGEKARRRDPRKYHYSGTACPDFRKGNCKKGDSCEFAHGVFECWLHPARYRTQPCKDGVACTRRVCFFAHTPDQLRVLPQQQTNYNDSEVGSPPMRNRFEGYGTNGSKFVSSPTSILTSPPISPGSDSPPMSPSECSRFNSVAELANSMRRLQVGNGKMGVFGFGSARGSILRPAVCSMPSTQSSRLSQLDVWESGLEEEPAMERVESGRDLRAKIYAKLSKENSLDRVESAGSGPDVAWVCELVK